MKDRYFGTAADERRGARVGGGLEWEWEGTGREGEGGAEEGVWLGGIIVMEKRKNQVLERRYDG